MALTIPQAPKARGVKTRLMNFRLPLEIIALLDEIADATGHNRTAILCLLVQWGAQEWRSKQGRDAARAAKRSSP